MTSATNLNELVPYNIEIDFFYIFIFERGIPTTHLLIM